MGLLHSKSSINSPPSCVDHREQSAGDGQLSAYLNNRFEPNMDNRQSNTETKSGPSIVYKIKSSTNLIDVPTHIFAKVAECITKDFFSQCPSRTFGAYRNSRALKNIDVKDALFKLGDLESWTVKDLVKALIKVDNRLAIRELVYYWPAKFKIRPNQKILVREGEDELVEVDAVGYPLPEINWYDSSNRRVTTGSQFYVDWSHQLTGGVYSVTASNRYKQQYSSTDLATFEIVIMRDHQTELSESEPTESIHQLYQYSDHNPTEATDARPKGSGPTVTRKVALLIGMTQYNTERPLSGPYNDLPKLAKVLTEIGFEVFTLLNLGLDDLGKALEIYSDLLDNTVYSFVYLSGHGQRFEGIDDDFLIPADAPETCGPFSCLSCKQTINRLQERQPAFNLFVWDACRTVNNLDENDEEEREIKSTLFSYKTPTRDNSDNLYEFYSTAPLDEAFEMRNQTAEMKQDAKKPTSSLTVMKFLELVKEGRKDIGSFLNAWSCKIYKQRLQQGGKNTQMRPEQSIRNPSLSLWDPVDSADALNIVDRNREILSIWAARHRMDSSGIYVLPDINPPIGIRIVPYFYMHNVMKLSVSADDPEVKVGILRDEMQKAIKERFKNGADLVSENWNCLRVKEEVALRNGQAIVGGLWKNVIIFHMQRFSAVPQYMHEHATLIIPLLIERPGQGLTHCNVEVRNILILNLFHAVQDNDSDQYSL